MGSTKFFTLKEARLSNNCPECYSTDGLEITFKQKFTENAFYKAITNDTAYDIYCYNCDTSIFPIQWTDDIERVVDYQQRSINPKPKSIKLKKLAWIIILLDLLLFIIVVLIIMGIINI
ncbi:hypothetical protein [uncultured Winogradskyella sp.]|uniref:hypothetical protein n=1 Tax=uncultured Winogradskyella sp. TaxID=395353 RepID=UPI0026211051|nr:hypothetical protein [uncultured Winogradskyella sp.]